MKRIYCILGAAALFLTIAGIASAATITFEPGQEDLWGLDHGKYYTWDIDWSVPDNEVITGASLSFDDIRNSENGGSDLWVTLLDEALTSGFSKNNGNSYEFTDRYNGQRNYFQNFGVELNHWHNLSRTAQDITYSFDEAELAALAALSADGSFGLGFDPDCHFYNNGISLTIETAEINPVPEPATMMLLGLGLLGVAGVARKEREID